MWALRVFPSAARVQSTSVPLSRSVSKFCMSVLWWLFHLRQNCWSSSMVVLASFPRFCTDEKTSVDKQRSVATDEKPDKRIRGVRKPAGVRPLPRARSASPYRAINRPNDPTLSRPPTTDYYRAHRAKRRTRESTSLNYRTDPTVPRNSSPPSLSFSFLARGPRGRTTEAKAPQRSTEASKMAV